MIYREYLTEYDNYDHKIKHNITISTDNFHLYKALKSYVENVCDCEEEPAFCVEENEAK
jgi:hypothetical protein